MSKRKPAKVFPFKDDECFKRLNGIQTAGFIELQEQQQGDNKKLIDIYAYIMCYALCDKEGKRIFSDEDLEEVKKEDFSDLKELAEKVLDEMGLSEEGKNLEASP